MTFIRCAVCRAALSDPDIYGRSPVVNTGFTRCWHFCRSGSSEFFIGGGRLYRWTVVGRVRPSALPFSYANGYILIIRMHVPDLVGKPSLCDKTLPCCTTSAHCPPNNTAPLCLWVRWKNRKSLSSRVERWPSSLIWSTLFMSFVAALGFVRFYWRNELLGRLILLPPV